MIPQNTIEKIKTAADILDVVQAYFPVKKKGSNYWAKSPWKSDERTPSFAVSPRKGIFKCFSTGKGGDVISFIREMEGFTYREALLWLADRYGIPVEPASQEERTLQERRKSLLIVNQWASDYFSKMLKVMNKGYFQERGLSQETVEKYALGWAIETWDDLLGKAAADQHSTELLQELGLISHSQKNQKFYDRFRARAIFPIRDLFGNVVGFGARKMDDDENQPGKYINSPESLVYQKSSVLYGLFEAKQEIRDLNEALLCEGYMDVTSLYNNGFKNSVGSCGTAFSTDQAKLLHRFCQKVVLCFDGDTAGVKAALAAIEILIPLGFDVRVILFPPVKGKKGKFHDPDSYIKAFGKAAFLQLKETAISWLEFVAKSHPQGTATEKAQAARAISLQIRKLPYELDQHLHAKAAAKILHIEESILFPEIGIQASRSAQPPAAGQADPAAEIDLWEGPRTWAQYQAILQKSGFKQNPDFSEADDGGIQIHFYDWNGQPVNQSLKKENPIPLSWKTTNRHIGPHEVYIPPGFRAWFKKDQREGPGHSPLFLAPDPITADLLDQAGIFALGLLRPGGFVQGKNSKKLNKVIKGALTMDFKFVSYLAPAEMFHLPVSRKKGENPYIQQDAGEIADRYVNMLITLKEAFGETSVFCIHPQHDNLDISSKEIHWMDKMLVEFAQLSPSWIWQNHHPVQKHFLGDLKSELSYCFTPGYSSEWFRAWPVSDMNRQNYQKMVHMNSPQAFYDFHGPKDLGTSFQLGSYLYEADRENQVILLDVSAEKLSVFEQDGQYWANGKFGAARISNFTIEPFFKIKGAAPYILAKFVPAGSQNGQGNEKVISSEVLLSADKLHLLAFSDGEMFFHGNNSNWKHLQELVFRNIPAAQMVEKLGWIPNLKGRMDLDGVFAFGDGIIENGTFRSIDEKGLIEFGYNTIYLPARSSFRLESNEEKHNKKYSFHQKFEYTAGETSMKDFLNLAFKVHSLEFHDVFMYTIATLFRDIVYKKMDRFPLIYLQGETSTGKSSLNDTIRALFGGALPTVNFENSPSVAAVGSLPRQGCNIPIIVQEFNVFKMAQKRQVWAIDMLKGWYDGTSRAKRQDAHSELLSNDPIDSGVIAEGQEAFYSYDEAVNNRFMVVEFGQRDFDTRAFSQMKMMRAAGLCHLTAGILQHRQLIKEKFQAEQLDLFLKLQEKVKTKVVDRMLENWSTAMAPLILLIKEGFIDYPVSIQVIIEWAVLRIEHHAKSAVNQGILGEFWDFVVTMYGRPGWLDDRNVFYYEKENQIRIHFTSTYQLFTQYLRKKGDNGITVPTKKNLKRKLQDPAIGFIEEKTNIAMGYQREIRMGQQSIKMKDYNGAYKPVLASKQAMIFDNAVLKLDISMNVDEADIFSRFQNGQAKEPAKHLEIQ